MPVPPSAYVEKVRELQESFQLFDVDRSGSITADELVKVLETLGEHVNLEQAQTIVRAYDVNGDGVIEFAEFLRHQARMLGSMPEALRTAFTLADDSEGVLDDEEVRQAIRLLWDGRLAEAQVEELAKAADADGDGRVALGELVQVMMRDD